MSDEIEVNVRQIEEQAAASGVQVFEVVRRLLLAGVGALALTRDEAENLVNRLVERGEIAQKDGERLLKETVDKFRGARPQMQVANVTEQVENNLEQFLNRLNIPSKRDIDELSAKIAQLAARVEELRRSQEPAAKKPTGPNGKAEAGKKPEAAAATE